MNKIAWLIILVTSVFIGATQLQSQCKSSADFLDEIKDISYNDDHDLQKSQQLLQLYIDCRLPKDSVYVKLLDVTGVLNYLHNDVEAAIKLASSAVGSAKPGQKGYSKKVTGVVYKNLGFYFQQIGWYRKAISYYDTAIMLTAGINNATRIHYGAKLDRAIRYLELGDYQKCIDECSSSIIVDSVPYKIRFIVKRAEAFLRKNELENAQKDAWTILKDASIQDRWAIGVSQFIMGEVNAGQKKYNTADSFFKVALSCEDIQALTAIRTAYGKYLADEKADYVSSISFYRKIAESDGIGLEEQIGYYVNISQVYFRLKKYPEATQAFTKALAKLGLAKDDLLTNIAPAEWNKIINKDLMMVMLDNKIELLLTHYKQTQHPEYLHAALESALVADSVLKINRKEQIADQSKLFWRQRTREIYQYALEASFLAKDYKHAFYFMEKSRAVLLSDKLNELAAIKNLPSRVNLREQQLILQIMQKQFLVNNAVANANDSLQLLQYKDSLQVFIKAIEKDYPAYYREKYADEVPELADLQQYLRKNQQSFVHYFMADTVAYIMAITGNNTVLKKISQPQYNRQAIIDFLRLCSQPSSLNQNYPTYVSLSTGLFQTYFQPFGLPKGRVIICPDTYLIPFEAISVNSKGDHFLVEDYAFSYVYAARNLLMTFPVHKTAGNYLGMAPGSFASYLKLPQLKNSGEALENASSYFSNQKLITGAKATKASFLENIGSYEVVNVYSHALSDSSIREPAIFMGDSVIYLSELQLINDISAQLVLLSACQTSVGQNATGEGIYSLARGLASVGIPSVAATLWEADEDAIYAITNKFIEGISKGLPKDIAMQQAKIWYLSQAGKEQTLPSYWANMILIGNASAVQFSEHNNYLMWSIIVSAVLVLAIIIIALLKRRSSQSIVVQQKM